MHENVLYQLALIIRWNIQVRSYNGEPLAPVAEH